MAPEEFLKLQLQRFTTLNLHPSNTDISVAVAGILNFFNCTTACLICAKAECKSVPGGVSSPPAPGCPFFLFFIFHLPLHAWCLLEDDRGGWRAVLPGCCARFCSRGSSGRAARNKADPPPPRARFPPWCPMEVFVGGGKGMGKTRPPSVGLSVVFCLHRWVFGGGKKKKS